MLKNQGRATPRSRNIGVELGVESRLTTPTLKIFKSTPESGVDFQNFRVGVGVRSRLENF